KLSSGKRKRVPKPTNPRIVCSRPILPIAVKSIFVKTDPIENEFGFLPPNQGSVKEKLYVCKYLPLDCARSDNFWPSPMGRGCQASRLKIFRIEKLLKVTPRVPNRPVNPPHPADNSNWSEGRSSRV